jgi:citrate synthase
MEKTVLWDRQRGVIRSLKGGWFAGKGAYSHGYSILGDLVGEISYFQMLSLNVLGFLPERRLADWLEAVHICLSWPDPRIWCNQIGALAGTARTSVVAATTAGVLAADSTMYGSRPLLDGVAFIQQALHDHQDGLSAAEIVQREVQKHRGKVRITGYARPLASGDERIPPMERLTSRLGFERGPHLTLAYAVEDVLRRDYNESMNINGYVSAFLSDQGFNAEQIYRLFAMVVMSGVTACYIDTVERPAETFLPLRCDDIDYQGPPPREVP